MGQPLAATRADLSSGDLRRLAPREKGGGVACRLLALAMVMDGFSRDDAARMSGMDRQTLRAWVHRYNADGVAGLVSRVGGGPAPVLSEAEMTELRDVVIKGPDKILERNTDETPTPTGAMNNFPPIWEGRGEGHGGRIRVPQGPIYT